MRERFQRRIEAGIEKLVRRVRGAKHKLEAGVLERQRRRKWEK
jgi:hypothetical protein